MLKQQFFRMKLFFAALALGGMASAPVLAQTAGNYEGTLPDGNQITVTVGTDGNGVLAVTSLSWGISATCADGMGFSTGWGIGVDAPLVNNTAKFTFIDPYIDTQVALRFSGNGVVGTIASATPMMVQPNDKPVGVTLCQEGAQTFTAAYSGAAAMPMLNQSMHTAKHN